jgi:homoserine dehydrogenase
VRKAREAGYTEPDPRVDLSGEDVRRKLLILARAASLALRADEVRVESLVPPALASLPADAVDRHLHLLDASLSTRLRRARDSGAALRLIARIDPHGARVGLVEVSREEPLFAGAGTHNRVAIHSDRYAEQPLLIQCLGAGAEVTAAALLDDVLLISGR